MDQKYEVLGMPLVGLSGIQRFSRRLKIRGENVAEHMWYTSYFTMQLCKEYVVGHNITLLALKYAICHDIPELILDDINHDVKERFPVIKSHLSNEESSLFREIDIDVYHVHLPIAGKSLWAECDIARMIVELADIHSVLCYVKSEEDMGNQHYFAKVRIETEKRLVECEEKLKEALTYYGSKTD